MSTIIAETSIGAAYRPGWGRWEGVRELVQNALDAGTDGHAFTWAYDAQAWTLTLRNAGAYDPPIGAAAGGDDEGGRRLHRPSRGRAQDRAAGSGPRGLRCRHSAGRRSLGGLPGGAPCGAVGPDVGAEDRRVANVRKAGAGAVGVVA